MGESFWKDHSLKEMFKGTKNENDYIYEDQKHI